MRRLPMILSMVVILITPVIVCAQSSPYAWTISSSNQDPLQNTGSIVGITAYLWFFCANVPDPLQDGMSAAEFDLVTAPPAIHLATITQNGFLNAGGTTNLLLAVGGCPPGPVLAANLLISGSATPMISIVPSAANGNKVTVDCSADPAAWPIDWIGFNDPGKGDVNYNLCGDPVSVEPRTWGQMKAAYR